MADASYQKVAATEANDVMASGASGSEVALLSAEAPAPGTESAGIAASGPEKTKEYEFSDLDQDAYGLVILRLVEWWDPEDITPYPKLATFHAVFLWALNLFFQASIALALLQLAETLETHWEPATFQEELNMTSYEAVALLREAGLAPDRESAEQIVPAVVLEKCVSAVGARKIFYAVMIFLWFSRNYGELEKSYVQLVRLWKVEALLARSEKILSDDSHDILFLEAWMKVLLMLVCPMTKLVITTAVTYAGMKFLCLQHSEVPLILKALCMQFVVTIDELLFTLTTKRTKEMVKKARLRSMKAAMNFKVDAWNSGLGGLAYLALSGVVTFIMMKVVFRSLFNFRIACNEYQDHYPIPGVEQPITILELFHS